MGLLEVIESGGEVTKQHLAEEDLLSVVFESEELRKRGHLKVHLAEDLQEEFLLKNNDIDENRMTTNGVKINQVKISEQMWGIDRLLIEEDTISNIIEHRNQAVADIKHADLVSSNKISFLHKVIEKNDENLYTIETLEGIVPGLTESTYQYNGGKNFLGDHIEHHAAYSMNLHHGGAPKIWNIIAPQNYYQAIDTFTIIEEETVNMKGFVGICERTHTHRRMYRNLKNIPNIEFEIVVQNKGDLIILFPFTTHSVENKGQNLLNAI